MGATNKLFGNGYGPICMTEDQLEKGFAQKEGTIVIA
jgi:hypothetical protein